MIAMAMAMDATSSKLVHAVVDASHDNFAQACMATPEEVGAFQATRRAGNRGRYN
jgi:hypothetical protein